VNRWIVGGAAALALGAAGVSGYVVAGSSDQADDDPPAEAPEEAVDTVEVVRRDLARNEDFDGTLGHGATTPLPLALAGTLTALPAVGTVLATGAVVAEVDGNPVLAIDGAFPFWRAMGPGASDGKDVLQLEYLLAELGYAARFDVTVDGEWTAATTDAVEAFQADHGQPADGTVELGELVVLTGPTRIDRVGGSVGQSSGEAGIELSAPERRVDVDVAIEDVELLPAGAEVSVELPNGEQRRGTVSVVGTAEVADDGSTTVPISIVVDGVDDVPDGTPVDVTVDVVEASGVLAVPVEAVLALAEGGYALEVADGAGVTHLVGVQLGVFADGMVEVSGDIAEGEEVVVP
jgi:hypothetical protein